MGPASGGAGAGDGVESSGVFSGVGGVGEGLVSTGASGLAMVSTGGAGVEAFAGSLGSEVGSDGGGVVSSVETMRGATC